MKRFGERFFFGFSCFANLRSPKTSQEGERFSRAHRPHPCLEQVIASVPDDKLLLESDLEDAKQARGALLEMLRVIADAKGWTMEFAAKKTWENAESFYSRR
eukprot:762760-Hanusia_phi.AAC.4